jgi:multidrug efflux pump subunit AcrB/outer membrane protein TolC
MKRNKSDIIAASMRNHNIIILITLLLMIVGVFALVDMPRNEFPQFTIRQGVIVGVYPGATSAEVEDQLTRAVENYIFSYQEVNKEKTYSLSKEGVMYVFVELNDNVKNADQFWSKIRHGLNELKMTLPTGVLALIANTEFGETSAILITLSSDTRSYKEMEEQVKRLEAECRKIPETSKIKRYGQQKEKIYVNIKPELLNEYSIKSISLLGSYQLNGMVNYAGVLKDGQNNLAVHLPASFASEKDLAEQIVYSDPSGNVIRLRDIASIERRMGDPDNYVTQNGKKTILVSLEMQPGHNIVQYGKDVDKALIRFEKNCPKDISVAKISELPKYVNDSISNFMLEFLIAILAVILVTMILLPLRISSVAAVTIPVSVLITLGILYAMGIELHTVSLATLIVVLGMIVDNSIVIIDNHVTRLDSGGSPWHTAIASARELFAPIVSATLAIFAAYFPLNYFMTGTAGEFLETIPAVVGVAMTVSVLVAVLLVPFMNFSFIKRGLKRSKDSSKRSFLEILQNAYDTSLETAFNYPKTVIGIGIASIAIAGVLLSSLERQLFPRVERNQFPVEIYLPTGSSLQRTAAVVDSTASILMKDKRVTNVTCFIGTSSPRFHTVYAPNMPASNYGQLLVNTVSAKATPEIIREYGDKYAEYFSDAHVKMRELALQPGKESIEIRITSDTIRDIRMVQAKITDILKRDPDVTWIHDDWDQQQQGIRVNLDRDKANRMGYTKSFVATSVMVGLDGVPLTTIWENDYPVEVILTQETNDVKNIKILEDQFITSPTSFKAMPLRSFATFSPDWNEGTIVRRNGVRTLTLMVENDSRVVASKVLDRVRPEIERLKLPEGTSISYGGEVEGQKEVFTPMTISLALSVLIIFFILMFEFKKAKLSLLIMSTMFLTLPGAAIGLHLMGYPFSLTSFLGITSLCGLVVRNGIILIDYLVDLRKTQRMTVYEAALAAGKRRMRPIFLTSAAAAVGVIPMILSRSLLWGPLGTVICFGLLFAMVLTLYILPILYWLSYRHEDRKIPARGDTVAGGLKTAVLLVILISGSTFTSRAQTLSLDSCKSLALTNNRKIKAAKFDMIQATDEKRAAFTNYFPKISAGGLAFRASDYLLKASTPEMNLPVYDGNPANLIHPTQFAYVPSLQLNLLDYMNVMTISAIQPVFAGGRIINGNRLAKIGTEISRMKNELTTTDVLVRTEELYWTSISLNEKSKTIDSYLNMLDTLERDVTIAVRAGLTQRTDLLKVQLKKQELEVSKFQLDNAKDLAKSALCQHIGITQSDSVHLISVVPEPDLPLRMANPENLVSNRHEIRMLDEAVKAEKLKKLVDLGENLPQVAIGVDGYYLDMMNNTSTNGLAFATVTIPISDWWGGSHKIHQNQARIESAENRLTETTELLALQVKDADNKLMESYFRLNVASRAITQAEENLKVTNDNYKAGITTMSDLLEAQSLYQKTMDEMTEAKCNFQIEKAKYLQATGLYR